MMTDEKCMPMREKVWPERDVDEKLDALRCELLRLHNAVDKLREDVGELLFHEHNEIGKLTVPLVPSDCKVGGLARRQPYTLRDKP